MLENVGFSSPETFDGFFDAGEDSVFAKESEYWVGVQVCFSSHWQRSSTSERDCMPLVQ